MNANNISDSKPYLKKIKQFDEKKFGLRKALYDIKRLSYEKGTRSGDYAIRERVSETNNELDLMDGKIMACESAGNAKLLQEVMDFFEQRFLSDFVLDYKINLLKQTLEDQGRVDMEYNKKHSNERYRRGRTNLFREELLKDIGKFEQNLTGLLIPCLVEFLSVINELIFYYSAYDIAMKSRDPGFSAEMNYNALKNRINYFIITGSKIRKEKFSGKEAVAMTSLLLEEMEIKPLLLERLRLDDDDFYKIITDSSRGFLKQENDKRRQNITEADKINEDDDPDFKTTLKNLRYLTGDIISGASGIPAEKYGEKVQRKHLYYSSARGKILLKDAAEYLHNSLLFINEWLLNVLTKSKEHFEHFQPVLDCLPDEIIFYDFFRTANYVSSLDINLKKDMWGDIKYFINTDLAVNIMQSIETVCNELKDAFVQSVFQVEFNKKSPEDNVMAKKINIIFEYFEKARNKIMKEMRGMI